MEIKYEIPENKVKNFTDSAKNRLKEQSYEYTLEIINEAEKVEKIIRENGASREITDTIIFQAVRRNKTTKKKHIGLIITRIAAEVLLFVAGLMFLPEKFVTSDNVFNISYFVLFAVVTLVALLATIITHFVGGD